MTPFIRQASRWVRAAAPHSRYEIRLFGGPYDGRVEEVWSDKPPEAEPVLYVEMGGAERAEIWSDVGLESTVQRGAFRGANFSRQWVAIVRRATVNIVDEPENRGIGDDAAANLAPGETHQFPLVDHDDTDPDPYGPGALRSEGAAQQFQEGDVVVYKETSGGWGYGFVQLRTTYQYTPITPTLSVGWGSGFKSPDAARADAYRTFSDSANAWRLPDEEDWSKHADRGLSLVVPYVDDAAAPAGPCPICKVFPGHARRHAAHARRRLAAAYTFDRASYEGAEDLASVRERAEAVSWPAFSRAVGGARRVLEVLPFKPSTPLKDSAQCWRSTYPDGRHVYGLTFGGVDFVWATGSGDAVVVEAAEGLNSLRDLDALEESDASATSPWAADTDRWSESYDSENQYEDRDLHLGSRHAARVVRYAFLARASWRGQMTAKELAPGLERTVWSPQPGRTIRVTQADAQKSPLPSASIVVFEGTWESDDPDVLDEDVMGVDIRTLIYADLVSMFEGSGFSGVVVDVRTLTRTAALALGGGARLGDVAEVATNFKTADFWLVRKGGEKALGQPVHEFAAQHIGVKVREELLDQLLPKYLYYLMLDLWQQGAWLPFARGTLRLKHLVLSDAKDMVVFSDQVERTAALQAVFPMQPAPAVEEAEETAVVVAPAMDVGGDGEGDGDLVVTLPRGKLQDWLEEGDAAGDPPTGRQYAFHMGGRVPKRTKPGDRIYVVHDGKLIGYSPLLRIEPDVQGTGFNLVRGGDAVACTIDVHIPGFRGYRYRHWPREAEQPFEDWKGEARGGASQRQADLREGKEPGKSAVVTVRIPAALARMWPKDDGSMTKPSSNGTRDPHFTVVYIPGPHDEEARANIRTAVAEVARKHAPFPVELEPGVAWFTTDNQEEVNREIAHKAVHPKTAESMAAIHWDLVEALESRGFHPAVRDEFKAHSTLKYCPEREYKGPVPEGGFTARELAIEGWPEEIIVPLSGAPQPRDGKFGGVGVIVETRTVVAAPLTGLDARRVSRLIRDWQGQTHDIADTAYWSQRFATLEETLAKTRPKSPVQLYRSEPEEPEQYANRFTAWSPSRGAVGNFGWGKRRLVTAIIRPENIVVDIGQFPHLDRDQMHEVIVRPGRYQTVPVDSMTEPRPPRPDVPLTPDADVEELRRQLLDAFSKVYGIAEGKTEQAQQAIWAMSTQEVANQLELVLERRPRQARTVRPPQPTPGVYYHGTSSHLVPDILQHGLRAGSGAEFAPAVANDAQLASEPGVYLTTWFEQAVRYGMGLAKEEDPAVIEVLLDPQLVQQDLMDNPAGMRWENLKNPWGKPGNPMMRGQVPVTQFYLPGALPPSAIVAVHVPNLHGAMTDVPGLGYETIQGYEAARRVYWALKKFLEWGHEYPSRFFDVNVADEIELARDELEELGIDLGDLDSLADELRSTDMEHDDYDEDTETYVEQQQEADIQALVDDLHAKLFTPEGVGYAVLRDQWNLVRLTPEQYWATGGPRTGAVQEELRLRNPPIAYAFELKYTPGLLVGHKVAEALKAEAFDVTHDRATGVVAGTYTTRTPESGVEQSIRSVLPIRLEYLRIKRTAAAAPGAPDVDGADDEPEGDDDEAVAAYDAERDAADAARRRQRQRPSPPPAESVAGSVVEFRGDEGNCYENAGFHVGRYGGPVPDGLVVHGYPTLSREPHQKYGHAWVEYRGNCIDGSTGRVVPMDEYYALGKIDPAECTKYTRDEVVALVKRTHHWGPWGATPPNVLFAAKTAANIPDVPPMMWARAREALIAYVETSARSYAGKESHKYSDAARHYEYLLQKNRKAWEALGRQEPAEVQTVDGVKAFSFVDAPDGRVHIMNGSAIWDMVAPSDVDATIQGMEEHYTDELVRAKERAQEQEAAAQDIRAPDQPGAGGWPQSTFKIPADLTGWMYTPRGPPPRELTIVFHEGPVPHADESTRGNYDTNTATINVGGMKDVLSVDAELSNDRWPVSDDVLADRFNTLRHELVHWVQYELLRAPDSPPGGLPSKTYDEEHALGWGRQGPEYPHALRDIEFYPNLDGELANFMASEGYGDVMAKAKKWVSTSWRFEMLKEGRPEHWKKMVTAFMRLVAKGRDESRRYDTYGLRSLRRDWFLRALTQAEQEMAAAQARPIKEGEGRSAYRIFRAPSFDIDYANFRIKERGANIIMDQPLTSRTRDGDWRVEIVHGRKHFFKGDMMREEANALFEAKVDEALTRINDELEYTIRPTRAETLEAMQREAATTVVGGYFEAERVDGSRLTRTANRKLKRSLGDRYALIEPAMALDEGAGTQYGPFVQAWLRDTKGDIRDDALVEANDLIVAIDASAKKLRRPAKLEEAYGQAAASLTDPTSIAPRFEWLKGYANVLKGDLKRKLDEYGEETKAKFKVVNENIVQTLNFDAACFLHGRSSGKRWLPWCGGNHRSNYQNYGGGDLRRYIVYPKGPEYWVTINGQKVPFSPYAFTVSVTPDGRLNNINDPNNHYPSEGSDFDRDGAEEALGWVNNALGLELSSDEMGSDLWEESGLDQAEWQDAGFFEVEEAQEWAEAGIDASAAGEWRDGGWSVEAAQVLSRTITPDQAHEYVLLAGFKRSQYTIIDDLAENDIDGAAAQMLGNLDLLELAIEHAKHVGAALRDDEIRAAVLSPDMSAFTPSARAYALGLEDTTAIGEHPGYTDLATWLSAMPHGDNIELMYGAGNGNMPPEEVTAWANEYAGLNSQWQDYAEQAVRGGATWASFLATAEATNGDVAIKAVNAGWSDPREYLPYVDLDWPQYTVRPREAFDFAALGFSPEEAKAWWAAGWTDPYKARRQKNMSLTHEDKQGWSDAIQEYAYRRGVEYDQAEQEFTRFKSPELAFNWSAVLNQKGELSFETVVALQDELRPDEFRSRRIINPAFVQDWKALAPYKLQDRVHFDFANLVAPLDEKLIVVDQGMTKDVFLHSTPDRWAWWVAMAKMKAAGVPGRLDTYVNAGFTPEEAKAVKEAGLESLLEPYLTGYSAAASKEQILRWAAEVAAGLKTYNDVREELFERENPTAVVDALVQDPNELEEQGSTRLGAYFENQTFSSGDDSHEYSVPELERLARAHGQRRQLPVRELLHNLTENEADELVGSPEFAARAEEADLAYPIIVIEYPDAMWIADGVHRLWKAQQAGLPTIDAWVLSSEALAELDPAARDDVGVMVEAGVVDDAVDRLSGEDVALRQQLEEAARGLGLEDETDPREVMQLLRQERKRIQFEQASNPPPVPSAPSPVPVAQPPAYVGAELAGETERYTVLKILSWEGSQKYGTREWCVARDQSAWDGYAEDGITFFYYVDRQKGPPAEYALAVTQAGLTELYDAKDNLMPCFLSAEETQPIGQHLPDEGRALFEATEAWKRKVADPRTPVEEVLRLLRDGEEGIDGRTLIVAAVSRPDFPDIWAALSPSEETHFRSILKQVRHQFEVLEEIIPESFGTVSDISVTEVHIEFDHTYYGDADDAEPRGGYVIADAEPRGGYVNVDVTFTSGVEVAAGASINFGRSGDVNLSAYDHNEWGLISGVAAPNLDDDDWDVFEELVRDASTSRDVEDAVRAELVDYEVKYSGMRTVQKRWVAPNDERGLSEDERDPENVDIGDFVEARTKKRKDFRGDEIAVAQGDYSNLFMVFVDDEFEETFQGLEDAIARAEALVADRIVQAIEDLREFGEGSSEADPRQAAATAFVVVEAAPGRVGAVADRGDYYSPRGLGLGDIVAQWGEHQNKPWGWSDLVLEVPLAEAMGLARLPRGPGVGYRDEAEWEELKAEMGGGWDKARPLAAIIHPDGVRVGDGNHRLQIAAELGLPTVWLKLADFYTGSMAGYKETVRGAAVAPTMFRLL